MIPVPSGARVWLASGHTDMRKGFDGLALLVQETLKRDPHGMHPVKPAGWPDWAKGGMLAHAASAAVIFRRQFQGSR